MEFSEILTAQAPIKYSRTESTGLFKHTVWIVGKRIEYSNTKINMALMWKVPFINIKSALVEYFVPRSIWQTRSVFVWHDKRVKWQSKDRSCVRIKSDRLSGQANIINDGQCMTICDLTVSLSVDLFGLSTVAKDANTFIFVCSTECMQVTAASNYSPTKWRKTKSKTQLY